jgi:YggT family protein
MSGVFNGLANVLDTLLRLYMFCIVIAVVLQLVEADGFNPIVRFFRQLTEPAFYWVRKRLPFVVIGSFDLSPLVIYLAILFLQSALIENMRHWGS